MKRKPKKQNDAVSQEGPDGKLTNAFLYDEVDAVPVTRREHEEQKRMLMELGLTEEEAKAIS